MRKSFVRAHTRRRPSMFGRAREPGLDFAAVLWAELDAPERRDDDRAAARERLRTAASEHGGAELGARLDAFAAGADPQTVEELATHLAASGDKGDAGHAR